MSNSSTIQILYISGYQYIQCNTNDKENKTIFYKTF